MFWAVTCIFLWITLHWQICYQQNKPYAVNSKELSFQQKTLIYPNLKGKDNIFLVGTWSVLKQPIKSAVLVEMGTELSEEGVVLPLKRETGWHDSAAKTNKNNCFTRLLRNVRTRVRETRHYK